MASSSERRRRDANLQRIGDSNHVRYKDGSKIHVIFLTKYMKIIRLKLTELYLEPRKFSRIKGIFFFRIVFTKGLSTAMSGSAFCPDNEASQDMEYLEDLIQKPRMPSKALR